MRDGLDYIFEIVCFFILCEYLGDISTSIKKQSEEPRPFALVQPPNYDREAALELLEKGECVGGTIHEGKFSVFVCKE